jgi:hypothetical protein
LREAVGRPGSVEIPESLPAAAPSPIVEIPAADPDADAGVSGRPLEMDPALMTVSLDRPNPQGFVRIYPEKILRTNLLAYKEHRDSSADYYYVVPEHQQALAKYLRAVSVCLLTDLSDATHFLWIVLASDYSPYYNALQQILSKGPAFVRQHKFRFPPAPVGRRAKRYLPLYDPLTADDPAPILPSRPVGQLLPEAMKEDHMIRGTGHVVYVALTSGGQLA